MVQTRNKAKRPATPPPKEPDMPKPKKVKIKVKKAAAAKPEPQPEPQPEPEKDKKAEEPIKEIAQAIIDLTKPTYDADYLHYLDVLRRNREWKAKHKADTAEYMKMRMADLGIRGRYNKARREAYALARAKGPARVRGRPRKPIVYNADAEDVMKVALGAANTVNVRLLVRATLMANPKKIVIVPDNVPEKFKKILGPQVEIPNNPDRYYFMAVGTWWLANSHNTEGGIGNSFKAKCLSNSRKLLAMDYTLPDRVKNPQGAERSDPNVISRWCLEDKGPDNPTPFDFWKTVNRLHEEMLIAKSRFNLYTTALATIWSATLRFWYDSGQVNFRMGDFDKLGWMCQIWAAREGLGHYAKSETFANRAKQEPSQRVIENIMDYNLYYERAQEFIGQYFTLSGDTYKHKPKTTFNQAKACAAVGCYLFIPPVRNSWALMEIADEPPEPEDRRNVLIITDTTATAYWGNFKNVKAFKTKGLLPLKQVLPPLLASLLRQYIKLWKAEKHTKWLFPPKFDPATYNDDELEKADEKMSSDFGDLLQNTTSSFSEMKEDGTGMKRIGSSILRIMFITWYHSEGDSVFDQEAIQKIMIQLHQTDLATHISYIKKLLKERSADQAIDAKFDGLLGLITKEANEDLDGVNVEKDDEDQSAIVVPESIAMTVKKRVRKPAAPK
jgi:hypothetical protein